MGAKGVGGAALHTPNGGKCPGVLIGNDAMNIAIERARDREVSASRLGGMHHLGGSEHKVQQATAAGPVSKHCANQPPERRDTFPDRTP